MRVKWPSWQSRYPLALVAVMAGCAPNDVVMEKLESVPATAVKTVQVVPQEIQRRTTQPATIHAYFHAEIRSRVSGFVKELKADIGQYVEKDAELALIDVPELHKQRAIAEARIRQHEAEERRSLAGTELAAARLRSSRAMGAEARAQLSKVDAALAAAQAEFNRTEQMVRSGSLQSRMLDEARMKRDSEVASKEAMASAIDSADAEIAVAEAQLAASEADQQIARANTEVSRRQLEEIDVMIAYATIRAPFSGIVTDRSIEPGDLVRELSEVGTGKPLFILRQVDKLRVRIPVPESDAPLVNLGDEVTLTFPSFSDENPIVASVTRRSGSLDPSTRTMMVEVDLANDGGKLLPGMFGQASINLETKMAANMLPSQSIRFGEDGKAYVYVVGDDDLVSIAQVTTGVDNGNSIEILAGIEAGQRVIGSHLKRFTDGQKVRPL
jgi:HlyD family secretion protein